jgi:hypothetical protein
MQLMAGFQEILSFGNPATALRSIGVGEAPA